MDPYVYPGSSVLRNRKGLTDPEQLAQFETNQVSRRTLELYSTPLAGCFDPNHLRAIHHYIFQDVFDWAGEFRTVNIARSGQFYFAFWDRIQPALTGTLDQLAKEQHLAGRNREQFCDRAAYYLSEINAIHPFRDGNGRAQREFIRELAIRNGHTLIWSRITQDQMSAASQLSVQPGNGSALAALLRSAS